MLWVFGVTCACLESPWLSSLTLHVLHGAHGPGVFEPVPVFHPWKKVAQYLLSLSLPSISLHISIDCTERLHLSCVLGLSLLCAGSACAWALPGMLLVPWPGFSGNGSRKLEMVLLYNKSLAFESDNAPWWLTSGFLCFWAIAGLECLKQYGHCLAACGIHEGGCCRLQVYSNNDDVDDGSMISTWSRPGNWFFWLCLNVFMFESAG